MDLNNDDPLLSLGNHVVDMEQRREIKLEVDAIEQNLGRIQAETNTEDQTASAIQKDLNHALTEMTNLANSSSQEYESILINIQVNQRFGQQMEQSFGCLNDDEVNVVSPVASPTAAEEESSSHSNNNQSSNLSFHKFLEVKTKMVHDCKREMQEIATSNIDLEQKMEDVLAQTRTIELKFENDGLEMQKRELEADVNEKRKTMEAELQAQQNAVEKLTRSRNHCGELSQAVADKRKEIELMKVNNQKREEEMAKLLEEANANVIAKMDRLTELEAILATVEKELLEVDSKHTKINEMKRREEDIREKRAEVSKEVKKLKVKAEELDEEAENVTISKDATMKKLEEAKLAEAKAMELRNANREFSKSRKPKLELELQNLAKDKERLAGSISNTEKSGDELKEKSCGEELTLKNEISEYLKKKVLLEEKLGENVEKMNIHEMESCLWKTEAESELESVKNKLSELEKEELECKACLVEKQAKMIARYDDALQKLQEKEDAADRSLAFEKKLKGMHVKLLDKAQAYESKLRNESLETETVLNQNDVDGDEKEEFHDAVESIDTDGSWITQSPRDEE